MQRLLTNSKLVVNGLMLGTYYAVLFFVGHILGFWAAFIFPLLAPAPSLFPFLLFVLSLAMNLGMGGRGGSLSVADILVKVELQSC